MRSPTGFSAPRFVTTGEGNLGTVLLPLESVPPAVLIMGLYTNLSSQPGTLLESWTAAETNLNPPPITTLVSVFQPHLASRTQYWFIVSPSPSFFIWYQNNRVVTGGVYGGSSLEALPQSFHAGYPAELRPGTNQWDAAYCRKFPHGVAPAREKCLFRSVYGPEKQLRFQTMISST